MSRLKKVPVRFVKAVQALCMTEEELAEVFAIPRRTAKDLAAGHSVKVTEHQLDIIASALSNQLRYAFATRMQLLLEDPAARGQLLLWVNMAAAMVDMFRRLKAIRDECKFINGFDPFLASMNSLALAMSEVEKFLMQLHENLPQFDEFFFSGTRFLAPQETQSSAAVSRVPSSVDILSASTADKIRYKRLTNEKLNGAQNGDHSEERGKSGLRPQSNNPCD